MINLARRMRWVLAAGAAIPAPLYAQFSPSGPSTGPVFAAPLPPSADPADRLAANLQILARNPRDLTALRDAGKSAIAVGDGNAALSFLARAEDLSPNDPSIKADLGSALLMIEQPDEALKLFSEATMMGYPERLIAKDRGLAYDLTGDPRRAQRDYAVALRQGNDDEITRRLALSLGISGDRDQGLKLLDPLLKKQDQAAWRARAFILAMNGNECDAERIVEQVMPPGMGSTMSPFLRRLASLTPAQRARAVNFGTMPDSGVRTAMRSADDPSFRPLDPGMASRLMPVEPPPAPVAVADDNAGKKRKPSKAPRRRPGRDETLVAAREPIPSPEPKQKAPAQAAADARFDGRLNTRIDTRLAPIDPSRLPPEVRAALTPPPPAAQTWAAPTRVAMAPPPPPPPPVAQRSLAAEQDQRAAGGDQAPAPVFEIPMPATAKPAPPPVTIRPVTLPATTMASPLPPPASVFVAPPPPPPPVRIYTPEPQPVFVATASSPPPPPTIAPPPPPAFLASVPASGPSRADAGLVPAAALPEPFAAAPVVMAKADPPPAVAPAAGLSSIIAAIVPEEESRAAPLPSAAELRAARLAAQKKAASEAAIKAEKDAKAAAAAEAAAKAKRNPARVWVQVATGNNEAGLAGTWKKLKEKAPDVFKGQSASVVPYKATNRVLVGPFKSQAEARALVNAMGKAGIQGTTFSSDAGQEVARIGGK